MGKTSTFSFAGQEAPLVAACTADDPLRSNSEAAKFLGVSAGTLEVWRSTKRYVIPYIKVGRLVKYRQSALDAFLEQRTVEG